MECSNECYLQYCTPNGVLFVVYSFKSFGVLKAVPNGVLKGVLKAVPVPTGSINLQI